MANNIDKKVIGRRQVLRQLMLGNIDRVILAKDADTNYKMSIHHACAIYGVEVVELGTVHSIADDYGIEVPSAVVGILVK